MHTGNTELEYGLKELLNEIKDIKELLREQNNNMKRQTLADIANNPYVDEETRQKATEELLRQMGVQ